MQGDDHIASTLKRCSSNLRGIQKIVNIPKILKTPHPKNKGRSGGAMVLGKLPVLGRPTILITVGQGLIALAVGAGGGGLDIFTLNYPFFSFSLSLGDGPI